MMPVPMILAFFPLGAKYLEKDIEDGIIRNIDPVLKRAGRWIFFYRQASPNQNGWKYPPYRSRVIS